MYIQKITGSFHIYFFDSKYDQIPTYSCSYSNINKENFNFKSTDHSKQILNFHLFTRENLGGIQEENELYRLCLEHNRKNLFRDSRKIGVPSFREKFENFF